ncbi:vegetative cell wall protein gp1-like, partial [Phasianus colchicus]|uniref:vegetative cell wall protein gp1-like n=1 Tax=Phasianus colchicus TaxID=9054 RepID=UPI00129DB1E0
MPRCPAPPTSDPSLSPAPCFRICPGRKVLWLRGRDQLLSLSSAPPPGPAHCLWVVVGGDRPCSPAPSPGHAPSSDNASHVGPAPSIGPAPSPGPAPPPCPSLSIMVLPRPQGGGGCQDVYTFLFDGIPASLLGGGLRGDPKVLGAFCGGGPTRPQML